MKGERGKICSVDFLRSGIFCLAFGLVACSHDKVAATEPSKPESTTTIPADNKPEAAMPEATPPPVSESAKPEPVAEKPAAAPIASEHLAILKPGQSTRMDASTTLQYVRVVSDSRCPVGTQCIWAGEATIELTLESGKEKQTFTLTDRAGKKSILGIDIELVSIDRGHLINLRTRKP